MTERTIDEEIDAIVARSAEPQFVPADASSWITSFERGLPFRLPVSYRSLFVRYRFPSFARSGVMVFGNVNGQGREDFVIASVKDPILSAVTRRNGLIQIGRPASGSYDPVCFDLRNRSKHGEAALVQLDHEEILIKSSVRIVAQTARSFLELLAGVAPSN
jgi:hypothetical protein